MSKGTANPVKPICEGTMQLANQVRRLRTHVAGYDSPSLANLCQMLGVMEESIDSASLRGLQAADAFDFLAEQMKPSEHTATVFVARKIEAFAGHCRDQRQLVEVFQVAAADVAKSDEPLHDDLDELSQKLAELERICNRTAARLAGV